MHRVTHFVDYREYILERVSIVQEDVRVAVIAAEAVCSARLASVFVHVYPALRDAFVHIGNVFAAERCEGCAHHVECFFVRYIVFRELDERHVHVVHVHFVKTEHFLAECHVSVEHRQVFVDYCNEVVVYFAGYIVSGKCSSSG